MSQGPTGSDVHNYGAFLSQCMTFYGRLGDGKQKFTESCGRTEKTLQHMLLIQDGFMIGAVKQFVLYIANEEIEGSKGKYTELFGSWLATRNAQTRTIFIFYAYFQQFMGIFMPQKIWTLIYLLVSCSSQWNGILPLAITIIQ